MTKEITFAEELLLLAINDEKGSFVEMPSMALEYALAGAILMDLAFLNRIDTDLELLEVIDTTPTQDRVLDAVLSKLTNREKSAKCWVQEIACNYENLKDVLLDRLVERGILKLEHHKILWVFSTRRYPMIDSSQETEVRTRIRHIILTDEIPDPRDVVIISLVQACDLVDEIFEPSERKQAYKRIVQISKMDLIGQAVNRSVKELSEMLTSTTSAVSAVNPIRV